jgi:uncharacterized iron-regulated membrane protein
MRVPVWLTLGVALLVCVFGLYRIRLALRKDATREPGKKPGLYSMARRTHALIGIVYLLLGGALIATSFGWNPFAGVFGGVKTETPPRSAAPTTRSVPIDQLPKPATPAK